MAELSEAALARLQSLVAVQLTERAGELSATVRPGPFLDGLVKKAVRRYPPLQRAADDDELEDGAEPQPLEEPPGGDGPALRFVLEELEGAMASPYFPLVHEVATGGGGSDEALAKLMGMLDRAARLKGILYRHGINPEAEYPALWGKVWEAIPKWDGRDFRAYVARIVRNHCLDEIARKRRDPGAMAEEDPQDPRPRVQTGRLVDARDAVTFVQAVLDELEASGRIKAVDGVIFALIGNGRQVADIVHGFRTSGIPGRFAAALDALQQRSLSATGAAFLTHLLDGLTCDEAALIAGLDPGPAAAAANALGPVDDPEEALLARALAREGLAAADLERASKFTTNAVNLVINRIRLKVWMALVDRAYEALRRRGAIGDVELAVVRERCELSPPSGCRMYKDHTCKRERDPAEIARRAGLDLEGPAVAGAMHDLRLKVVEDGLGRIFPDYNSCLIERKPGRRR